MIEWIMIGQGVIVGLMVLCLWYTFQEGEIFGFVTKWGDEHVPEKLRPPLYDCNVCMTFWYGSGIYWIVWRNTWIEWLIVVFVAMGFNIVINKLSPEK